MQEVPGNDAVEKLVEMTEKYPYFGLAHLLLLKFTNPTDPAYPVRAAKAGLFVQNDFQLNDLTRLHQAEEPLQISVIPATRIEEEIQHKVEQLAEESDVQIEQPIQPVQNNIEPTEPETPEPAVMQAEPNAEHMLFEPLHTTDYFASQGIKLNEEQQGSDKLAKQLRSFTDWLKTMKKVHETRVPLHASPIDRTVEHMAEKSNKEDLIITETMAEAYVAQGKINKAREIYSKLSLINPAKSSFFAAKIEQLNEK